MKNTQNAKRLPLIVGILGLLGLLLRGLAGVLAVDSRNLIRQDHILVIGLWLVTAVTAVLVIVQVRSLDGGRKYSANFSASKAAALGCGLMALGVLVTVGLNWAGSSLGMIWYVLGLATGVSMIFLAFFRFRGQKPNFLLYILPCAFFAVHMVIRYRPWSGDPVLLDYFFKAFACVGMMLFAYHQAEFTVGMGKRRMQLALGLLTAYCCLAAIPDSGYPLLYLGGAAWTLSDLCSLTPPPRRKKLAEEAPREDQP